MKSAALALIAVLLFLSPALALEGPGVVVDEEPDVRLANRLATSVDEEPTARIPQSPTVLVQEDSDAQPQNEPPPEPPPDQGQQGGDEQAQPEQGGEQPQDPPPPPENQPEDPPEQQQQEPQEPPVPAPQPPEMRRESNPAVRQASETSGRVVASVPTKLVAPAPTLLAAAATAAAPAMITEPKQQASAEQTSAMTADEPSAAPGQTAEQRNSTYMSELTSDFRYTVNNAEADIEDVVTAPLHIGKTASLFSQPAFYYTVLGAGAALGGAFALDQTARAHIRHIGNSTADGFETGGNFFVYGSTGLLYLWGLQSADANLREHEITGLESSGVASLITLAFKNGFGRLRPHQGHGHFAFFDNGDSFVSSAATPVFALAAATSEAYDNAWYVAIPAYLGATAVGVGRMGKDDHWLSDIVGSALLGIGTTELMLYMHRWHAENPSRFRIFPVSAPNPGPGARQAASQNVTPEGLGVSYQW